MALINCYFSSNAVEFFSVWTTHRFKHETVKFIRVLNVGTIISHLWNKALLINCKAVTKVTWVQKIFPKSPTETAGSYCQCLGGHRGTTTCVRALYIIVLF